MSTGLTHCQNCGKSLEHIGKPGRPKRNCSDYCRNKHANRLKAPPQPRLPKTCKVCDKSFIDKPLVKLCSDPCRMENRRRLLRSSRQVGYEVKHPNGVVTAICGWCKEPRTYPFKTSTVTAFHVACRKEAERARYRIKTVKRQNLVVKPSRLAADEVVRTYGSNCSVCQEPIDLELKRTSRMGLTVDHWIPLSKGGSDDITNLRPAHWICNLKKSNSLPKETNA